MSSERSDDAVPPPLPALPVRARGRAAPIALASALWVWVLAILLPAFEVGSPSWAWALVAVLFPCLVVGGVGLEARAEGSAARLASSAILFVAAPLSLVLALGLRDELLAREVLGALHASLLVLACGIYALAVVQLTRERSTQRPSTPSVTAPPRGPVKPRWPSRVRALLLATCGLGAIALVGVAPLLGGHARRVSRFGLDGAELAALLAAAVGLVISLGVFGILLPEALRAPRPRPRVPLRLRGAARLAFVIACVALFGWLARG